MLVSIVSTLLLAQAGTVSVSKVKAYDALRVLNYAPAPTGSKFAASLENNTIRVIDAKTGTTTLALVGHPQQVYGLAFNRAGTTLASGDESGRIWLWDLKTGKKVKEFPREKAHIRGIQALSFSPDGKLLASTGKDDAIIIWNVATAKQVKQVLGKGANVASGTFAPTGGRLYAASLGTGVQLYATKDWAYASSMDGHHKLGTNDFALDASGNRGLSGGRDNGAAIWDLKAKRRTGSLIGHDDQVMRVAVSPNGRVGATSANDRQVIVWDLVRGVKLASIPNQSAIGSPLAFTADGRFLITATVNDTLQINSIAPPQGVAPAAAPKRRR